MADIPDFVMFCTMDGRSLVWLIGFPENEIDAMEMFNAHIARHDQEHALYIHMERNRWGMERGDHVEEEEIFGLDFDPADNLFRVPDKYKNKEASNG